MADAPTSGGPLYWVEKPYSMPFMTVSSAGWHDCSHFHESVTRSVVWSMRGGVDPVVADSLAASYSAAHASSICRVGCSHPA